MNFNQDSPRSAIVNLINNLNQPRDSLDQNIKQIIENLQKKKFALTYDGFSFCQLTGEVIGNQKLIKLKINNNLIVNLLETSLANLIQNYCFVNGRFERCFSTIDNIQFIIKTGQKLEYSNPLSLEITDDILKQVYGEEKFINMMEEIKSFYQENQNFQENIIQNPLIKCPKTQKYISFNDGFNIQGTIYSLKGALIMLNEEQDKLFDHQKSFLNQYKKQ